MESGNDSIFQPYIRFLRNVVNQHHLEVGRNIGVDHGRFFCFFCWFFFHASTSAREVQGEWFVTLTDQTSLIQYFCVFLLDVLSGGVYILQTTEERINFGDDNVTEFGGLTDVSKTNTVVRHQLTHLLHDGVINITCPCVLTGWEGTELLVISVQVFGRTQELQEGNCRFFLGRVFWNGQPVIEHLHDRCGTFKCRVNHASRQFNAIPHWIVGGRCTPQVTPVATNFTCQQARTGRFGQASDGVFGKNGHLAVFHEVQHSANRVSIEVRCTILLIGGVTQRPHQRQELLPVVQQPVARVALHNQSVVFDFRHGGGHVDHLLEGGRNCINSSLCQNVCTAHHGAGSGQPRQTTYFTLPCYGVQCCRHELV